MHWKRGIVFAILSSWIAVTLMLLLALTGNELKMDFIIKFQIFSALLGFVVGILPKKGERFR